MGKQPLVSVIFTSYTTERLYDIYQLLDSLQRQTFSNLEILFVAERSKELSSKVGQYAREKKIQNLLLLFNDKQWGLSSARNLGLENARGDIICFLDDDVIVCDNWATLIVERFQFDSKIIGLAGPAYPLWLNKSMDWLPPEFHWIVSCTSWLTLNDVTDIRNVWGHNFSFRADAFKKCGAFSIKHGFPKGIYEGFLGEDNEFSMRVKALTNMRIVYDPKIFVRHRIHNYRLSWRFIIRRSYGMGFSRQVLKHEYDGESNLLSSENALLKKILTNFVPREIKQMGVQPTKSIKSLFLAATSIFSIAIGFIVGLISSLLSEQSKQ